MTLEQEFVSLCLQTMKKSDYSDKQKRKIHNAAADKLNQLIDQIRQMPDAEVLLKRFLSHEDSRVRIYGSLACLQLDMLYNVSARSLRRVIVEEPDPTLKASASMLLKKMIEK